MKIKIVSLAVIAAVILLFGPACYADTTQNPTPVQQGYVMTVLRAWDVFRNGSDDDPGNLDYHNCLRRWGNYTSSMRTAYQQNLQSVYVYLPTWEQYCDRTVQGVNRLSQADFAWFAGKINEYVGNGKAALQSHYDQYIDAIDSRGHTLLLEYRMQSEARLQRSFGPGNPNPFDGFPIIFSANFASFNASIEQVRSAFFDNGEVQGIWLNAWSQLIAENPCFLTLWNHVNGLFDYALGFSPINFGPVIPSVPSQPPVNTNVQPPINQHPPAIITPTGAQTPQGGAAGQTTGQTQSPQAAGQIVQPQQANAVIAQQEEVGQIIAINTQLSATPTEQAVVAPASTSAQQTTMHDIIQIHN